jgi:dTDP-glucose pyrophosphorylase/CBS domain-containing protein
MIAVMRYPIGSSCAKNNYSIYLDKMKNDLNKYIIKEDSTLLMAMKAINENYKEIVFVVDKNGILIGVITDGDIRRGLLKGLSFETNVAEIMSRNYISVDCNANRATVLDIMRARDIRQVPVLDKDKRITGIHFLNELIGSTVKPNIAVIMAGGKGIRLRPLTEDCPKPMIKVAGRPILERVILHLVGYGVRNIYISINYHGDVIENYFGDGSQFGCEIKYLREEKPLGTGGALSLFNELPQFPFIVMNGDLLTQVNIGRLLDFHSQEGAEATIAGRPYKVDIPFGVIINDNSRLVNIQEKPSSHYLINSGIYVFNPSILSYIPKNVEYPITSLFDILLDQKKAVSVYILEEEWADVGRHDELKKAKGLYQE